MKTANSEKRAERPTASSERRVPMLLGVGTFVAILIVVGLVAVLTFVRQMTNRDPGSAIQVSDAPPTVRLSIPDPAVETTRDFVMHSKGHQDFWFRNAHPTAVEVGLTRKNCDCTGVSVATLSPEAVTASDWSELYTWTVKTQTALIGLGAQASLGNLLPAIEVTQRMHEQLGKKLRWQELFEGNSQLAEQTVTLPAGAIGIVRVGWEAKKELKSTDHLIVELWSRTAGSSEPKTRGPELTVPLRFVRALRLEPEDTGKFVGEVGDNRTPPTTEFVCWSSTRKHFRLEARADNPCLVPTVEPLNPAQVAELEKKQDTAVWSGYVVRVTVYDQRDGAQLDLGPFVHRVHLIGKTAEGDSVPEGELPDIMVTGIVRGGDLHITSPAVVSGREPNEDKIFLGTFRADRAKSITATITTRSAEGTVDFDRLEPPALKELLEVTGPTKTPSTDGKPSWSLRVTVPANRVHGPLPENSAILLILKVPGSSPRGIRVPITGEGYTSLPR